MDEPREGIVLSLVNYLPGASNLRALPSKWSESGICRAPSPLLQASSNLCVWCCIRQSSGLCCLSLEPLWLLGKVAGGWGGPPYWRLRDRPAGGEAGALVELGPALQSWGALCVLTCVCVCVHTYVCSVTHSLSYPFLWVSDSTLLYLCPPVCLCLCLQLWISYLVCLSGSGSLSVSLPLALSVVSLS